MRSVIKRSDGENDGINDGIKKKEPVYKNQPLVFS